MSQKEAIELKGSNFDETVSSGVTLIDFWAEWCGPCQTQGPIVEEVAGEAGEGVTVGKVDVESEQELAKRFGVMSIPALVILRDGSEVERFVGVQDKATLLAAIEKASG